MIYSVFAKPQTLGTYTLNLRFLGRLGDPRFQGVHLDLI